MRRNGWRLLFHEKIDQQLRRLVRARNRASQRAGNANTRLLDATRPGDARNHPRRPRATRVPARENARSTLPALAPSKDWTTLSFVFPLRLAIQGHRLRLGQRPGDATRHREQERPLRGVLPHARTREPARRLGRSGQCLRRDLAHRGVSARPDGSRHYKQNTLGKGYSWERGRPARNGPKARDCSSGQDARAPGRPLSPLPPGEGSGVREEGRRGSPRARSAIPLLHHRRHLLHVRPIDEGRGQS